jgi:hypothetical protein
MYAEWRPPKPAWAWLYAMLVGIAAFWVIAVRATEGSEGDRWLDLFFLVLVYGVIWGWLQANRAALELRNQRRSRHRPVRIIRFTLFRLLRPSWHPLGNGNGSPCRGRRGKSISSPDGKHGRS